MLRRDCLKFQGAFLCCWSCPARGRNGVSKGSATPDTAVAKGTPSAATRAAVELLGGMSRFVKKVVIKPNMRFVADVVSATNTHPVGALLRMCLHAFRSGRNSLVTSGILSACDGVREGQECGSRPARHKVPCAGSGPCLRSPWGKHSLLGKPHSLGHASLRPSSCAPWGRGPGPWDRGF